MVSRLIILIGIAGSLWAQSSDRGVTFDRILHADREPQNWLTYSGTVLGHRHSVLTQITPANVKNLELAWTWQARTPERTFEATPLVVDGVLYTVQPPNDVVALDAETGRPLWTYAYASRVPVCCRRVNRGLAILGDTLFMGTIDAHLLAIDAKRGTLIWDTVVADAADAACRARTSAQSTCYSISLAPLVVHDKVIVGTGGGDTEPGFGTRGSIAAFNVNTGREVWRFSTVPKPGDPGNETWSAGSWRTGGVGVWITGSYDSDLNLTYWGTGNPAPPARPDMRLGDNLYSDSVVALDADTGLLKWHYQFTPHDERDWDAAQVPVLAEIQWHGSPRKVILQATKNGIWYVLDRATGELLLGTPFVEVTWMRGFDKSGRPQRVKGNTGGPGATNWYPPSYSPSAGLFYIPAFDSGGGALRAFDPVTGDRRWEFRTDDGRTFTSGVLTTASDVVFTGDSNANFYALHARTGALLWKTGVGGGVSGGPISYSVGGRQYIEVAAGHSVFAFVLRQ